jgi:O-antigen/teichoic acid export membrane protein
LSVLIYWFAHAGLVAPGTVYAKPELPLVLAIVSFSAVITGLESTRVATAGRYLAQGRLTFMEISSQLSGVAIMLIWAMINRSVWALVIGGLFTNIVKTIMSHLILPGVHNRWRYERDAFHEIFHFGKWIFISSVFSFLIINGDRILLGGLISAEDLGIYVIACFIVGAITHMAGKLMANVSFPVLSETARNKPNLLKYAYYRFRIPFDLVLFSLAGLLFFSGRHIIEFLYDPRYLRAGEMLEVLSISIIALRYTMIDQCFMAMGMPKLMATMNIIKAFGLFILLPVAYKTYGMTGALWGIVLSSFTSVPLTLYYKHKLKMLDVVKEIIPTPFFLGGVMIGAFINWLL